MKCPVCKIDMMVVEYHKIEVDYCTRCAGVWFDCGELELLVGAGGADLCKVNPDAKSTEKGRKCPLCGKHMNETLMGDEPKVLIDACPAGEGLWFDGGEVDHVLKQAAAKAGKSTESAFTFLGDLFQSKKQ